MNKKRRRLKKITGGAATTTTAFVLKAITLSHKASAFAECRNAGSSGTVCLEIDDICVSEAGTVNMSGEFYTNSTSETGYPARVLFTDITSPDPILTISEVTLNNYPSGAPPSPRQETFNFSFPTPEVDADTGRVTASVRATGYTYMYSGGWNPTPTVDDLEGTFTVYIDHINTPPVITSRYPINQSFTIDPPITSTNMDVRAVFQDEESNNLDIVFELSTSQSFSSIIATSPTYNIDSNSDPGVEQGHTFQNLSLGTYFWRATATETDAGGICAGVLGDVYYEPGTNYQVRTDGTEETFTLTQIPVTGIFDRSTFLFSILSGLCLIYLGIYVLRMLLVREKKSVEVTLC